MGKLSSLTRWITGAPAPRPVAIDIAARTSEIDDYFDGLGDDLAEAQGGIYAEQVRIIEERRAEAHQKLNSEVTRPKLWRRL